MPDEKSRARVARLRQSRRESGLSETNVWVPSEIREVIDQAVENGQFASRRLAIIHALEQVFAPRSAD